MGTVRVIVQGSSGNERNPDDWNEITRENKYGTSEFSVEFVEGCQKDNEKDRFGEKYLSMESGVLVLREGPVRKYTIDFVYEI